MNGKGSKAKGAKGELEFAALLTSYGFTARRQGRQFFSSDGIRDHADVTHNVNGIHFEVKRREKLDVPAWMRQCAGEAGARIPVVAWRGNRQPWRVILNATDFLYLIRELEDLRDALKTDSQNTEDAS